MIEKQIQELIEGAVDDLDLEVVRVMIMGDRNKVLQIMLDRKDETALTIDDCSKASREISAILDVEDPLEGAYHLEVSSPGIDRPLTRLKDFKRFAGEKAKIELKTKIENRRRFSGDIKAVDGDKILIEVEGEILHVAFDDILKSKLIMSDALINAASKGKEK